MVNSRQKGRKGENLVLDLLNRVTQQTFEQTPGSGSGKIKGDLYLPHKKNVFLIEVKFYKDDALTSKIFTSKSNPFVQWWSKTEKQALESTLEPLLFFKANYGQIFVATQRKPEKVAYFYISWLNIYVCLAEPWLENEKLEWSYGKIVYRPWDTPTDDELIDS